MAEQLFASCMGREGDGLDTMTIQYRLVRSSRRTLALEVRNGELIVRAPRQATQAEINRLLQEKQSWIEKHLRMSQERKAAAAQVEPLTAEELNELGQRAVKYIPERVRYYAPLLGVHPRKITIRNQRTRWGSCSASGSLNFNCILMLTPPEVIDSVVVHELCHLIEMNHSDRFYQRVYSAFPEYDRWHGWLKEHQTELLAKLG